MTVDAHHHFWDPALRDYPWMTGPYDALRRAFGPDDLRPLLDECGVEATIVVQARGDASETTWLLETASLTDWIVGVVGWIDLTATDASEQIAEHRASPGGAKLVGIRHQAHDEPDAGWLARDDVRRGLEAVGEAGLVYDLLVRTRELPAAHRAAQQLPDLQFVVDHLAKPRVLGGVDDDWTRWMSRLSELPNVAVKLSGLVTEGPRESWSAATFDRHVRTVVDRFGADRLLFGSDWPVCELAASYREVLDLAHELVLGLLSPAERTSVFGGNALRLYAG
ncbi:MAG TPA: amidohydrolase family protein [Gaiellaceae bacterium]